MTSTEKSTFAEYDTADYRARSAIDCGISDIVRRTHGPNAMVERLIAAGWKSTHMVPIPEAGIKAALMLRDAAAQALDRQIHNARGDGLSWERIAELLGYTKPDERGVYPAEQAFYLVAPQTEHFTPSTARWECRSCSMWIADRGPFESHPENNETGHRGFSDDRPGEPCPRFAAEVEAWKARVGE